MDDFNDFLGFMVTNSGDVNNGDAPGCLICSLYERQ